jgi:hypothetical protein
MDTDFSGSLSFNGIGIGKIPLVSGNAWFCFLPCSATLDQYMCEDDAVYLVD